MTTSDLVSSLLSPSCTSVLSPFAFVRGNNTVPFLCLLRAEAGCNLSGEIRGKKAASSDVPKGDNADFELVEDEEERDDDDDVENGDDAS